MPPHVTRVFGKSGMAVGRGMQRPHAWAPVGPEPVLVWPPGLCECGGPAPSSPYPPVARPRRRVEMGEIEAHLARGLHRVLRDVRWFPNSCPGPRTQVATLSSLNGESLPWVQAPFTPCSHRLDGELVDMGPEGTGGNPGVQVRGGDQKLKPEQCCLPRGGDRMSEVRAASQTPLPGGESKWSEWCLRSWLSHP